MLLYEEFEIWTFPFNRHINDIRNVFAHSWIFVKPPLETRLKFCIVNHQIYCSMRQKLCILNGSIKKSNHAKSGNEVGNFILGLVFPSISDETCHPESLYRSHILSRWAFRGSELYWESLLYWIYLEDCIKEWNSFRNNSVSDEVKVFIKNLYFCTLICRTVENGIFYTSSYVFWKWKIYHISFWFKWRIRSWNQDQCK